MLFQKHDEDQMKFDGGAGWLEQLRLPTTQQLPGDMGARGNWHFEDTMSWNPYSQFSCGVGVANLYTAKHAERLVELTKKYGKIFIFTISRTKALVDYVNAHPESFEILATQESWMDQCPIQIVGSHT